MSIRSSLLILLLLTSTAFGDAIVTVSRHTADSSATANLNNLAIPRWQGFATTKRGQFGWYMSPLSGSSWYPATNTRFLLGTNLQTAPAWSRVTSGTGATTGMDHVHVHSLNDTVYMNYMSDRLGRAYFVDTSANTMTQLFTFANEYATTTDQYASAVYPIPGSDSAIKISRGIGSPTEAAWPTNVLCWYSTNNGQTWGGMDTVRDWTNHTGRHRVGLFPYGNSVGFVGDSSDVAIVVSTYQRGTRNWTDHGAAITTPTNGFRAFSANTVVIGGKTYIVVAFTVMDVNAAGDDSLLTAYKNVTDGGAWTRFPDILVSTGTSGVSYNPPYVQFSLIENTNRLVMFYTTNFNGATNYNNQFDIAARYLKTDLTWSQEYEVTTEVARGSQSYKLVTAPKIPTNHGDYAYVGYTWTDGGYNKARMAVLEFNEYATTNITSLPYTISTSNQTYTINGVKLSSQTNGITIATGVHDIIIDGQGDTIEFDLSGATVGSDYTLVNSNSGYKGIIIGSNCYNVTIRNLVIKHNPPSNIRTDSTLISNAVGIRWAAGGGTHDILIEGCHISIAPVRNAWAIVQNNSSGTNAHYNNIIRNNTIADSCNAFARRDYWEDQTAICLLQFTYGASAVPVSLRPNFQYHLKLEGNNVAAFWANLFIEGDSSVVIVENNTFQTDGWNRLDGTPYDAMMYPIRNNTDFVSCTENYCISIKDRTNNPDAIRVKIIGNTFNSGSNHAGGRGIFTAGAKGRSWSVDDHIYIAGNFFDVHQGPDNLNGSGENCMAFIARQGAEYVTLRDNYIRVTGDNNPATTAYGRQLVPIRLTCAPTSANLRIIANTIVSYYVGTPPTQNWLYGGSDAGSYGIMFDEADDVKTNWTIDSNTTLVQGAHLQYGWYNGPSGACRVTNHTFGYYPGGGTNPNNTTTYIAHQGDAEQERTAAYVPLITGCLGNEIVDPTFIDGTSGTHLLLENNGAFPQSSVKLSVTLAIRVVDSSGNPVEGATVIVTNAYGQVDTTGTTGPNGYFRPELPYWYEENVAAGNNDSTAYNPYTIDVTTLAAATASSQLALDWNNKTLTMIVGSASAEARPITHIGGLIRLQGHIRIDNADVPDLNDTGPPVGD